MLVITELYTVSLRPADGSEPSIDLLSSPVEGDPRPGGLRRDFTYVRVRTNSGGDSVAKFESILGAVGNTPVVRINKLGPEGIDLYVKVESFNPMGSVKDRLALGIIEDAERRGALKPGQTVIEATSGNTGIGLAMVCAQKGYPLVVTMAENFSVERRKLMRFLGARVVLTPASEKGTGMLRKAEELATTHGWFLCRQFENEANAEVHSRTTAREILADFEGERLDYWVTGFGTGGTLKGVSRVLKQERPETKIVVCEPDNSPLLGSGIAQIRNADGSIAESHPSFRTHLMQGWTPDFIPRLAEDAQAAGLLDIFMPIKGNDALSCSQALAQKEGIFVGISAGATLAGALQVAATAPPGSTILAMLPDTGERYLSTPLFYDIAEDMTAEEIEISRSTPSFHFDAPAPAPPEEADVEPRRATPEAAAFVEQVIHDPEQPVVLFAFEWCEFCWSVRKLFAEAGIPYRSIDLDSAEYQVGDWGGQVRAALNAHFNIKTIPQIVVGGKLIGGATETFDAFKEGELQELLGQSGVEYNQDVEIDPYSLLPTWLHLR
jgi:cysteine synthase A